MASIRIRGNKKQGFSQYNTRARPLRGIEYVPLKFANDRHNYKDEPIIQLYEHGYPSNDAHSIVDVLNARQLGKPALRRADFSTVHLRDLAVGSKVSEERQKQVKRIKRKYPGIVNKKLRREVLHRNPVRWKEEASFPISTKREIHDIERDFDFYHQPDTSIMKPGTSTNFTGLQNLPNSVEDKQVREKQNGSGVYVRHVKKYRMRGPMKRRHR